MAFKHILLHLDATENCEQRTQLALQLAKKGNGFIKGVFCQANPGMSAIVRSHPVDDALRKLADEAEAKFTAAAQEAGVEFSVSHTLCTSHAQVVQVLTWAARTCDLAVLGQYDWSLNYAGLPSDLAESVILHSGRPVLVIPFAGKFPDMGSRCLIAWNGGRESARALHDAVPMMTDAKSVKIFAVEKESEKRPKADEAVAHLEKHDIQAEILHERQDKVSVSDMLLSNAADESSNLLIMGAHGHYGVSTMLRGSNTREILKHMTLPVLMSH